MSLRILVADDHAAVRAGLRMIVESAGGHRVVGEAADGGTAVSMARSLRPDIVLMDIRMPGVDGIAATQRIVDESLATVLVLTTFDVDDYVFRALRAGASGFLLKSVEPDELVRALGRVGAGDAVLAPEVTGTLIDAFVGSGAAETDAESGSPASTVREPLTAREKEIYACLGEGLSNQQICRRLGIAETTVKTHVSRVLAKLGMASRVQAAISYRQSPRGPAH